MAVAVGAVNHDAVADTGFLLGFPCTLNVFGAVVRAFRRPAQDEVAAVVPLGGNNGGYIDDEAFPMRYEVDYVRVYQK